jgi:hypothetical protein
MIGVRHVETRTLYRNHGPLIKSPDKDLPQATQQEESPTKGEDS